MQEGIIIMIFMFY